MDPASIQKLAYFAIIVAIISSIPQMIKIIKNKSYRFINSYSFVMNAIVFGIFTVYAYSFQDYLLMSLYGILLILNSIILVNKVLF
jgi:uncharacterized protein with PQ loop repeat